MQYPANDINATYDDKQWNAEMFAEFMLPQHWMPIKPDLRGKELQQRINQMAQQVRTFLSENHSDKEFVLKGSHATCESSLIQFKRDDKRVPQHLRSLVADKHQHSVGIQPFSLDLRTVEVRMFVMPVNFFRNDGSYSREFVIVETVLTRPNRITGADGKPKDLDAAWPDNASYAVLACKELVQRMLALPAAAAFFHKLKHDKKLSLPVLRFDCFFDTKTQRAFFNECAPAPDCILWSGTHGSSISAHIGKYSARSMLEMARAAAASPARSPVTRD